MSDTVELTSDRVVMSSLCDGCVVYVQLIGGNVLKWLEDKAATILTRCHFLNCEKITTGSLDVVEPATVPFDGRLLGSDFRATIAKAACIAVDSLVVRKGKNGREIKNGVFCEKACRCEECRSEAECCINEIVCSSDTLWISRYEHIMLCYRLCIVFMFL